MIHDKVQKSKKQPNTMEDVRNSNAYYKAQGVYLNLASPTNMKSEL